MSDLAKHPDDDILVFAEDQPITAAPPVVTNPWRVLVVDDDPDVHLSTAFALDLTWTLERPIQLLRAESAAQARDILAQSADIAVVLLDVVMETPDAGLRLVDYIRRELGMTATRIVLRTGQPGYAPEHDTLARYDINDYRSKSELTQHKLVSTLMAAVRSYEQVRTIEASRRGLQQIVLGSAALMEMSGLQRFADGVLTQVAALLGVPPQGLVCAQGPAPGGPYTVLAAAGPFVALINQPLERLNGHPALGHLQQALKNQRSHWGATETVLYVGTERGLDMAIYLPTHLPHDEITRQLLDVLCVNLSACLRNLDLVQRLQQVAYQDPLLGIANRARLIDCIEHSEHGSHAPHRLILADIDDFNGINELMGHPFGDRVLQALAQRLLDSLPATVTLARVSGNSFGLFGATGVLQAEQVLLALEAPLSVDGQPFKVRVSMGCCQEADLSASGADALKNASIALKHAKLQHRSGLVVFDADMAQRSRHHAELLERLTAAFNDQQLFLVYQPQIDLDTRAVIGLEALLRWRREDGQMVPPDRFIPVAEQSGLIDSLGLWVFNTACHDMQRLIAAGLDPKLMAINVSVAQFKNSAFVAQIEQALLDSGLAADRIELEITESVAALGHGVVEPLLQRLRGLGFSVAIDDFGTGYSSLAYLERLPLDRIKIDREFVSQLQQGQEARIAALIAQLGGQLGLRVLAEGIEDAAVWRKLQDIGCHEGQGFHIAKPMPFEDLLAWLRQWNAGALT
ncbi:MAG: hypothetical protein JM57_08180 [Comamonadaceae bacterium BICA1-1]|nr:MAG: hypothetical protein JM57_08180 [Comamonadaceae bacterium BICA1-1]